MDLPAGVVPYDPGWPGLYRGRAGSWARRRWRAPGALARRWLVPGWAVWVPALLTIAVMLWGLGGPSYWRDEAASVSAVSRSLPELWRMLGHVDAVHGLYYLLLWPLTRLLGTAETVTRLPSALAMAAAAAGIAAIGRRLRSPRAGVCAGLVFAITPAVTQQGHDARPYAMVTAAAVLASYLLIRAAAGPRARWFAAYAASLALLGYLHLFALLLVPAHALALYGLTRDAPVAVAGAGLVARRWLTAVAAAAAAVAPLAATGWGQRGQIAWLARPGWHDIGFLVTSLGLGSALSAVVATLLAVLGAGHGDAPPFPGQEAVSRAPPLARPVPRPPAGFARLTWLAVPWLVLPPLTMLLISAIWPVYYFFYVVFCLPAAALLAGAGLAALAWPRRVAAITLLAVLVLPAQLALRAPGGGGSLRATARFLAAHARPGDAVLYPGHAIPPWYLAYPRGFAQLRDIGLARSAAAAGSLDGSRVSWPVLAGRERAIRRLWAVELGPRWQDPAGYLVPGFRLVGEWQPGRGAMRVWLFQR